MSQNHDLRSQILATTRDILRTCQTSQRLRLRISLLRAPLYLVRTMANYHRVLPLCFPMTSAHLPTALRHLRFLPLTFPATPIPLPISPSQASSTCRLLGTLEMLPVARAPERLRQDDASVPRVSHIQEAALRTSHAAQLPVLRSCDIGPPQALQARRVGQLRGPALKVCLRRPRGRLQITPRHHWRHKPEAH